MPTTPAKQELVIFTAAFDLLDWLLPKAEHFPRQQRFVVTQRLLAAALDFQEALFDANARSGSARAERLAQADAHLDKLRLYLRLAHRWQWLGDGAYEHVSRLVAGVGKLLGGWIRQTRGAMASP
jgi:hypothetical protein